MSANTKHLCKIQNMFWIIRKTHFVIIGSLSPTLKVDPLLLVKFISLLLHVMHRNKTRKGQDHWFLPNQSDYSLFAALILLWYWNYNCVLQTNNLSSHWLGKNNTSCPFLVTFLWMACPKCPIYGFMNGIWNGEFCCCFCERIVPLYDESNDIQVGLKPSVS